MIRILVMVCAVLCAPNLGAQESDLPTVLAQQLTDNVRAARENTAELLPRFQRTVRLFLQLQASLPNPAERTDEQRHLLKLARAEGELHFDLMATHVPEIRELLTEAAPPLGRYQSQIKSAVTWLTVAGVVIPLGLMFWDWNTAQRTDHLITALVAASIPPVVLDRFEKFRAKRLRKRREVSVAARIGCAALLNEGALAGLSVRRGEYIE